MLSLFLVISNIFIFNPEIYNNSLPRPSIKISIELEDRQNKDSVNLVYKSIHSIGIVDWVKERTPIVQNDKASWTILSDEPVTIFLGDILKNKRLYWLSEPGDNIKMSIDNGVISISGVGSEKYKLLYELDSVLAKVTPPSNVNQYKTLSVDDFFEYGDYLDAQKVKAESVIDSYAGRVSTLAYNYIKTEVINEIEENRLDKFGGLKAILKDDNLTHKELGRIFDSCFYSQSAIWARQLSPFAEGWYAFVRAEVERKYNYNYEFDSLKSRELRKFLYFQKGKELYHGLAREKFFLRLMTAETIYELGFNEDTEKLLAKYYMEPGYPEYKQYVRNYEYKARLLREGSSAPSFILRDAKGNMFSSERIKDKIALLDFWFTGCVGCAQMVPAMKKVEKVFENDSNIIFLSVSIDQSKEKWLGSLQRKIYTTGTAVNLYTDGQSDEHPIIAAYGVSEYPRLYLIDRFGKIAGNPVPDPRTDNGRALINTIKDLSSKFNDGPYIFKNEEKAFFLDNMNIRAVNTLQGALSFPISLEDENKELCFSIKKEYLPEPSEFKSADKIFVLSDIEGNLQQLCKLLISNGVINKNLDWTFGNGHLVFCGDMFDRGSSVTECLWFMYTMEQKAQLSGGYVHFILGNHEIMNLNGDSRYVNQKYIKSTELLGISYKNLYGKNTEMGQWLRSKNIIEKIGEYLFVHAGISDQVNKMSLSIPQINDMARPYYDLIDQIDFKDNPDLKIIFDTKASPFWYRLYYQNQPFKVYPNGDTIYMASEAQVQNTLEKFGVKHIITGHTIVSDTVSLHYHNKVINVDTKHAEAKSEALYIIGNKHFRVDSEGKKYFLFETVIDR